MAILMLHACPFRRAYVLYTKRYKAIVMKYVLLFFLLIYSALSRGQSTDSLNSGKNSTNSINQGSNIPITPAINTTVTGDPLPGVASSNRNPTTGTVIRLNKNSSKGKQSAIGRSDSLTSTTTDSSSESSAAKKHGKKNKSY
jgi:hypothetical protein